MTQDGRPMACFNTGLVTRQQEEIIGFFVPNTAGGDQRKWMLKEFAPASDSTFSHISRMPDVASYYSDPADLIYDTRLNLRCNTEHVLEDCSYRFPKDIRANKDFLKKMLLSALD